MPNIASLLREEITRLSRKETRSQVEPAKKAGAQHRKDIAALKRQVTQLERQVASLAKKVLAGAPVGVGMGKKGDADGGAATGTRFSAKGLRANRSRLGLSAGDFGKMLGVSAQSVYNWEREESRPRGGQIAKLAALRKIGKREAAERLKPAGATKNRARSKG